MTLRKSWTVGATNPANGATAQDARLAHAGLFEVAASGVVRAGVLGNQSGIVASRSDMALDVNAFEAVLTRGASYGVTPIANDGIVSIVLPAAPSSNSRWVRVYVIQRDNIDGADANNNIELGYVAGAAAASPTLPALPTGALALARVLQPANVLGTADCTVTEDYPMTAARGGVVPVRDQAEMTAWTPEDGGMVFRIDQDFFWERVNGAWTKRSRSFTWGTIFAGNANVDGLVTVNHGLGVVPDWVQATTVNTANDALDKIASATLRDDVYTATQVRFRMRRSDTNNWFPNDFFRVSVTVGKN
jgi:hypothetical protein